ncbi:hypothetical protein [Streptomyces sp. TRM68367]|uniref:hypothetical protein n=1 Tax=Streptomyces sp. TRM68367 TaxID=2758415 RepID=UPI00165A5C48|nr:hypothetical protein [Streptomyces sp. TRM68367]MBC9723973.1 hypothetical protein [Streptomyces sp. TRM68367]
MGVKRKAGWLLVASTALSAGIFAAPQAVADPADCNGFKPTITLSSDARLSAGITAFCSVDRSRYYRGEIKWDKNFAPDPLTSSYTDHDYDAYDAGHRTCDNQNTRKYYSRGFFTSGSDYHDSTHRDLTVGC